MTALALYSLRSTAEPHTYRITKFTPDLELESSYLIGPSGCECPGYQGRNRCRHETIRDHILAASRVDTNWFLEFTNLPLEWRQYLGDQAEQIEGLDDADEIAIADDQNENEADYLEAGIAALVADQYKPFASDPQREEDSPAPSPTPLPLTGEGKVPSPSPAPFQRRKLP